MSRVSHSEHTATADLECVPLLTASQELDPHACLMLVSFKHTVLCGIGHVRILPLSRLHSWASCIVPNRNLYLLNHSSHFFLPPDTGMFTCSYVNTCKFVGACVHVEAQYSCWELSLIALLSYSLKQDLSVKCRAGWDGQPQQPGSSGILVFTFRGRDHRHENHFVVVHI